MPAQSYDLNRISLKLRTFQAPTTGGLVVRLYDNNSVSNPGAILLTFLTPTIPANTNPPQAFAFIPPSPFTLSANTTYWVVAYYTGSDIPGWTCGNPSTIPTGLAQHIDAKFDLGVSPNPPTTDATEICQYEVVGTSQ